MLLKRSHLANWQSLPHSSASARTVREIGKSTRILLKMGGCGHFSRKCARTFALAGLRNCRDRQGGPACFEKLPPPVQKLAREKYALWKRDPCNSSLHF